MFLQMRVRRSDGTIERVELEVATVDEGIDRVKQEFFRSETEEIVYWQVAVVMAKGTWPDDVVPEATVSRIAPVRSPD